MNALPLGDTFDRQWEATSTVIEQELKKEKRFHSDDDKLMFPFENGMPSIAKFASYAFEGDQDEIEITPDDDPYSESLADAVDEGAILEEEEVEDDEEIATETFAEEEDKSREEEIEVPDDGEPIKTPSRQKKNIPDMLDGLTEMLPKLASPPTQSVMCPPPDDLFHSLARDLIKSKLFHTGEHKKLLPALLFYDVGIEDRETFWRVRYDAYAGGRAHFRGKEFSFEEYTKDRSRIYPRLRRAKNNYFVQNLWLKKIETKSIWQKFDKAYKSLTLKQRYAIEAVHVDNRTMVEAAKSAKISYDSFRDRLEGAVLKFRKAIPELAKFLPEKQQKNVKVDPTYPLYRVDRATGKKVEIPYCEPRRKQNTSKPAIKAWAQRTSPMPDFSFTDFFLGNLPQGHLDRISSRKTPHDNGASNPSVFYKEKARPFVQGDTDEDKHQAIQEAYRAKIRRAKG